MTVRAVCFDVGSTLLFPKPSVPETFYAVAQERGHELDLAFVRSCMPEVDAYYDEQYLCDGDFWCSHERATAIWYDMYRLLSEMTGLGHDADWLCKNVHECYRHAHHWATYDDVIPCLKALKQNGLRLGVISNWDAELESLIRELGLLPYFDVVVSSAARGYRKPDSIIFEQALSDLGLPASEVVHVGDLPEADGAAARVGIRPVIIDRHDALADCECDRITSLLQLPQLVS